jgi:hypothetical protein
MRDKQQSKYTIQDQIPGFLLEPTARGVVAWVGIDCECTGGEDLSR